MLESLDKINVKNIVLESGVDTRSTQFKPANIDKSVIEDLEKDLFEVRFDGDDHRSQKLATASVLKVLHPSSLDEFSWTDEEKDRYVKEVGNPIHSELRDRGRVVEDALGRLFTFKTVFPHYPLTHADALISEAKEKMENDKVFRSGILTHMRLLAPEVMDKYVTDEMLQEIWDHIKNLSVRGNELNIVYNAYNARLLRPSSKKLKLPDKKQKELLDHLLNEESYVDDVVYLAVASADEVRFENGIELFFHKDLEKPSTPPYPEMEKV